MDAQLIPTEASTQAMQYVALCWQPIDWPVYIASVMLVYMWN